MLYYCNGIVRGGVRFGSSEKFVKDIHNTSANRYNEHRFMKKEFAMLNSIRKKMIIEVHLKHLKATHVIM